MPLPEQHDNLLTSETVICLGLKKREVLETIAAKLVTMSTACKQTCQDTPSKCTVPSILHTESMTTERAA